jgi:hypothetical protein
LNNKISTYSSTNLYTAGLIISGVFAILICLLINADISTYILTIIFTISIYNVIAFVKLRKSIYRLRDKFRVESKIVDVMLFNGKPIEKIYVSRNAAELISKQIIVMCKHQHKKIIIDPEYKQMEVSTNKKKEILVSFEDLDSII